MNWIKIKEVNSPCVGGCLFYENVFFICSEDCVIDLVECYKLNNKLQREYLMYELYESEELDGIY